MKILSDKRFKRLFDDLRSKSIKLNRHKKTINDISMYLHRNGFYIDKEEEILSRIENLVRIKSEEAFREGKEFEYPIIEVEQDINKKQRAEIEKLIKQNNELHEYIRNNSWLTIIKKV